MGGESTIYFNLAAHNSPTGFITLREGGAIVVLLCPASAVRGHLSSAVSCGK